MAVIGGGMAALALLEELKHENFELDSFDAGELAPGCSAHSTAVVAGYGVRRGLSPHGDDLAHSLELADQFYRQTTIAGVYPTDLWHGAYQLEQQQRFAQRFGDSTEQLSAEYSTWFRAPDLACREEAWLIDAPVFLKAWKKELASNPSVRFFETLIVRQSEGILTSSTGETYGPYEQIIWAIGASGERFELLPKQGSRVSGHALVWESVELGERPFALSVNGKNLIYQAWVKRVYLGGSTDSAGHFAPALKELKTQWESWQDYLTRPLQEQLIWERARVMGAVRHKAPRRRLLVDQLNSREIVVNGLYKNGYSLAFLAATKVRELLTKKRAS